MRVGRRGFSTSRAPSAATLLLAGQIATVLAGGVVTPVDFYVSPTGTGSATTGGTSGDPWPITMLTDSTARARYAGKTVGLMDGTYNTSSIAAFSGGYTPAIAIASGSIVASTVITAVNARMAIVDDSGGSAGRPVIGAIDSSCSYITLKNLKVRGARQGTVHFQRTASQAVGIRVDGCEVYDQSYNASDITPAIFFQACDDAIVTNCYIHDINNTAQASSVAGVQMYGSRRTIIEKCTFPSSVYTAIHDKYAGGTPRYDQQQTIVRQNYFVGNVIACWGFDNKDQTGTPPTSPPYGAYSIYNNVFENVVEVLTNPGAFSAASPMNVYSNTIYASSGAHGGLNLHTLMAGCEPSFYNNIWFFSNSTWTGWRALTVSVNGSGAALANVIDFNCYGPGAVEWNVQTGYGYPYLSGGSLYSTPTTSAAWQAATGKDATGRSLFNTNPQFAFSGSGAARFQLGASSPCLNAGRVGGVVGGAVIHMGAWDGIVTQIGCDF